MEIILTEKDLGNAVKLYLAFSGVTRVVTSHEFARKLKGNDAGISVSIELDDNEMSAEELHTLALTQKQARGLNERVAEKKHTSVAVTPESVPDEQIPFTTKAEDTAISAEHTEKLTAKAEKVQSDTPNPFAEAQTDPTVDPEPEPIEATAVEGNELPGGSPFAEAMSKADANEVDYSAPEPENPFGNDALVTPATAEEPEAAAPVEAPINLFG